MTNTEFKFEELNDGSIVIKKFEDPALGYVTLAWDSEDPLLLVKPKAGKLTEVPLTLTPGKRASRWSTGFAEMWELANAALELHDAIIAGFHEDDRQGTGYNYLRCRPHIKVAVRDVTGGYAESWLSDHGVARVEETWFYDDSRRTHICSLVPSIEAWAINERIAEMRGETEFGELTPEMEIQRDRAEGELAGFENWIDYFGDLGCDYDAGPASDQEVFDLMTGKTTYEEYMEVWRDYFRSNEVA